MIGNRESRIGNQPSRVGNRNTTRSNRIPGSRRSRGTSHDVRVTIRRATLADVDAVTELRLALLGAEWRGGTSKPRGQTSRRARALSATQLANRQQVVLLALHDEKAIGLLRCAARRRPGLLGPAAVAFITTVYVRPAWRRRGVLRALVRAAERWARAHRLTEMQLLCAVDNAVGRAAWKALGFEPIEILHRRSISAH